MRQVYRSPSYLDALTSLYEGILAGHRILILAANPGMGKTTLLRDLKHRLDRVARTLFLSVLDYETHELLHCLLAGLGSDDDDQDCARLRNRLSEILESASSEFQRTVLFIDEAHVLRTSTLESLLVLSNSDRPGARSVQMVIAGRPQLLGKLACPELAQFQNR
jgi:type II secretory pathway predicted ATPase ExeA